MENPGIHRFFHDSREVHQGTMQLLWLASSGCSGAHSEGSSEAGSEKASGKVDCFSNDPAAKTGTAALTRTVLGSGIGGRQSALKRRARIQRIYSSINRSSIQHTFFSRTYGHSLQIHNLPFHTTVEHSRQDICAASLVFSTQPLACIFA